jgi:hypothetical protein
MGYVMNASLSAATDLHHDWYVRNGVTWLAAAGLCLVMSLVLAITWWRQWTRAEPAR